MTPLKLAVAVLLAAVAGRGQAFHSGGVAECEGCHSMHNSFEGSANVTGMPQYQSGPYLLKAQDQSSTCLNCHQSADTAPTGYHVSTAGVTPLDSTSPVEMTPGGDFAWLKKTMTGKIRGTLTTWDGERHGHNIIAVDYGYAQDKVHTVAPGGTYPAGNLHCSSCHDPHGRYRRFADGTNATTGLPIFNSGSYTTSAPPVAGVSAVGVYRKLSGVGYQPKSLSGSFAFTSPSPDAVAPASYNGVNVTIAGTFDRVAYGSGFSEWCANCHAAMHLDAYTSGTKGLVHPAGNGVKFTAAVAANYAAYVSSGIMTGTGAQYSSLAPFETGNGKTLADYTALKAFQASPVAPTTSSNVMCLSCHRSHASAFESKTRYYLGNEFMTVADSSSVAAYDTSTTENKINQGYDAVQQAAAYNGRPASVFGPFARNYCNKCHAKD
jgi:hypothetical protein